MLNASAYGIQPLITGSIYLSLCHKKFCLQIKKSSHTYKNVFLIDMFYLMALSYIISRKIISKGKWLKHNQTVWIFSWYIKYLKSDTNIQEMLFWIAVCRLMDAISGHYQILEATNQTHLCILINPFERITIGLKFCHFDC